MNSNKRKQVESNLDNVVVRINSLVNVLGSIQKESKEVSLSVLTDKEISDIHSNHQWGMKSGIVLSKDRTEGVSIVWKIK